MLTMTQVYNIRKLYFEEGKNINQIAKMTGFDTTGITSGAVFIILFLSLNLGPIYS